MYPYLTYSIEICGNIYKTNIISLFEKQKKIVRIICNANYLNQTDPLNQKQNMLQLQEIVKYFTGTFMFKTFQNALPSSLEDRFALASSQCCKTRGYEFYF